MEKEQIEGVILILSCQKHKNTRLKEFSLPKDEYCGWKVIYVLGDFFLDTPYKLDGNMLTIKCEDSYIHLLKKIILAIQYVYEIFHIKQGILRSGDDLIYNIPKLEEFLVTESKPDFVGYSPSGKSNIQPDPEMLKVSCNDSFMVNYYNTHPEDFKNPQHNLRGVNISKYITRPRISIGPAGVLFYISNHCCQLLVTHMRQIDYDVFHYDEYSKSYPYTIEDCGVAYILYFNRVGFLHDKDFVFPYFNIGNSLPDPSIFQHPKLRNKIAIETNKYK